MGIIEQKRKFKPKKKQTIPTNPTGTPNLKNNKFDIDKETIKKHQNKS